MHTTPLPGSSTPNFRVVGLDSIRILCAFWVLFGHGAAPKLTNPFDDGSLAHFVFKGFFGNIWSGPSAVIVFFVISGFCIHFPFAGSNRKPLLLQFYTRRFLRLLIPLLAAVPLGSFMGIKMTFFSESILWSLFAELMYYLFYPILRATQLRLGSWSGITTASFLLSFAVIATNPTAGNYASFGTGLNWLLGLPCWLLGCLVAEKVRTSPPLAISSAQIWTWRFAVIGTACACSILRFHTSFGYPWTLNWFAILAAFWLHREISFRTHTAPPAILERAGLWSYSLYLLHVPAGVLFSKLFPNAGTGPIGWLSMLIFVLSVCYGFYLLVERPSHNLAKSLFHSTS